MNSESHYNREIELMRLKEFPALHDVTYLDHAGTTLVARSQLEAHHRDIIDNIYGNPHSRSPSSQLTSDTIDQVRYRILKHFNTTPEEYTVIFTSGCTGALKLVAESFDFYGNHCSCCHGNTVHDGKQETSNDEVTSENKDLSSASQRQELHESNNFVQSYMKFLPSQHGKGSVRVENSTQSTNFAYGTKCKSGCYDGIPSSCYGNDSAESSKRGSFVYLLDNHTSVQGMREIAFTRAGRVSCVDCDEDTVISKEHVVYQHDNFQTGGNCLFAYPAQSNFSGKKYPMDWISKAQNGNLGGVTLSEGREGRCYVLLDAACLVGTSTLDLRCYKPDFVTLSFYKMFGYPTGLGALLVRNSSSDLLRKTYYGGGTVSVSLSTEKFHVFRSSLADRFEDGTVSFLDIISLRHGFQALDSLAGGLSAISDHTFSMARYFYTNLRSLQHGNGRALAEVYCHGNFEDPATQGAIITFNCLRANGDYIGFSEVDKLAQLHNIHFRTGCFCNLAACQKFLNISNEELKNNFDAGHVCGDDKDLIDGKPTGAVRVSLGYMSSLQDVRTCLQFLVDCFLENSHKPVFVEKILKNQSVSTGSENIVKQPTEVEMKYSFKKPMTNDERAESSARLSEADNQGDNIEDAVKETVDTSGKQETFHTLKEHQAEPKTMISSVVKLDNKVPMDDGGCIDRINNEAIENQIRGQLYTNHVVDETLGNVPAQGRILTDIFVYPIKSCGAFKAQRWPVSDRGLLYDREWMIVTESGVNLSLKKETKLCLLQPQIDLDLQRLVLNYPGFESVSIPLTYEESDGQETNMCSSKVCGDRVQSVDCGQQVSDWLSEVLGRSGCRLIRQKADNRRISKLNRNGIPNGVQSKLTLANESQYLLLNRATVNLLIGHIQNNGDDYEEEIDCENLLHRFRGNLVVGGGDPFEEETWQSLKIGNICFKSQGTCTRCQMVCFDPHTGQRSREPLKTLAVWREKKMTFGVYFYSSEDFNSGTKTIQVGDSVISS